MKHQKRFVLTKRVAKHGSQAIIVVPRMLESRLKPGTVVQLTIDVMYNDIFGHEYKTSVIKMKELMNKHFAIERELFTWQPDAQKKYGDCLFVLRKKQ